MFLFFLFPETYRLDCKWDFIGLQSEVSLNTAAAENGGPAENTCLTPILPPEKKFNPLQSLFLLKYLFVLLVAIEIGFCFGAMFTLETLIPDLYYEHYGFESWQTGKIKKV